MTEVAGICPPQRTAVAYNVGDKVEVIGREKGLKGSFYEATIVSVLDDGRYEVVYKTLIQNYETRDPVKERVSAKYLRPMPPRVRASRWFKLVQFVNVWDNEGWWYGMISSLIGRNYYNVYFPASDEQVSYHYTDIRVHHDFIEGEWFRA